MTRRIDPMEERLAPPRTVADIVSHYLEQHRPGLTLDQIAEELKKRTGSGSDSAISAWSKGPQVPAPKQIKELRRILGCHCLPFGDEAIVEAYRAAATASTRPEARQPRAGDVVLISVLPDRPAPRPRPSQPHIVGRQDEVRDFADLLAGRTAHRLVNIFGPGGIGKTEVFHKFVAFGQQARCVLGYADVAEIRYSDRAQPFTAAEMLRALAATINHVELDPFRRDLGDYDLAAAAVRAAGGVGGLFGPGGRPVDESGLFHPTDGVSPRLREAARNRFAFERYLRQASATLTGAFCDGLRAIAEGGGGATTLLLDTYEEVAELDDWICRDVVPMLPEHTRLIILGRGQLTKTNIDWLDHQDALHARSLPELSENETKAYLRHYGLTDPTALQRVFAVTGGYPLLLVLARALAAESGGWNVIGELEHDRDRDTIATGLLERILREERVRSIREVLETCSLAPWIDPGIVAELLEVSGSDAHSLYTELATHSIVIRHPRGVALHDKVRELLQVRLKFASEARYRELTDRLTAYLGHRGGASNA